MLQARKALPGESRIDLETAGQLLSFAARLQAGDSRSAEPQVERAIVIAAEAHAGVVDEAGQRE